MSQTHLLRRNGIFYYRRRVPLPLVEKFGKKVILFSLGTADPKEAKKRRALEAVKWDAQFDLGERSPTHLPAPHGGQKPAQGGLIELVRDYIERTDERSKTLMLATPPDSMAEKADMKADLEIGCAILKNPDDPRGAEMVHATGTTILATNGLDVVNSNTEIFAEIVRRGLLELQNRKLARIEDDFSHTFFDPAFSARIEIEASFGETADQFIQIANSEAVANGTSQKWVDKQRANVTLLKEIVGEATPIGKVHYDACMNVRTVLAAIPANRNKAYKNLAIDDAIKQAKFDGKPTLSPVTQDQ